MRDLQDQDITVINLTGEQVLLLNEKLEPVLELPERGFVLDDPRREGERKVLVNGVELTLRRVSYGPLSLPPEQPGIFYLVRLDQALLAPGRGDLLVPGPPVHDGMGGVLGFVGLDEFGGAGTV